MSSNYTVCIPSLHLTPRRSYRRNQSRPSANIQERCEAQASGAALAVPIVLSCGIGDGGGCVCDGYRGEAIVGEGGRVCEDSKQGPVDDVVPEYRGAINGRPGEAGTRGGRRGMEGGGSHDNAFYMVIGRWARTLKYCDGAV